ncbi:MAG TPA: alkaline phosphatase PafA [Chitinophagaceae bacterium]|nr:alkaline phosphatase PafA [Chitinophagaceae bacterium]
MQRLSATLAVLLFSVFSQAQNIQRPKLVVGLVVDQMRWDYLYRYYDRYAANGGFKRLLNDGYTCENTMIPYAPTVTACGHSCIYTGSVPAINGMTGNLWWDYEQRHEVYCTDDKTVKTVGSTSSLGQMSPRNLLVTTVCDELKLATNFRSKVIGIALKDRGGILPAGHTANAAYWYDNTTGDWITSTYYMNDLPKWVKDFNAQKLVDKYYRQGWNTLFPLNTYKQSTEDNKSYEGKPFGTDAKGFPYDTKNFAGKNYYAVASMPQGNTLTSEFAKAAITGEQLGNDDITDFLAVSFSSPDYIGHGFGPNSIEEEDNYLRLDKEIGDFLDFLDSKTGKGQYLVFLSADHGVAHVPGFLKEHNIPAGNVDLLSLSKQMNAAMKDKFGKDNLIVSNDNYQFYLNHPVIDSARLNMDEIKNWIIDYLSVEQGIARVFKIDKLMQTTLNSTQKTMLANGYYPKRSGDIQVILKPQYIDGFTGSGTTHGVWSPYDAHIPLVWYGWNIKHGATNRETYMTDIAPTIAAMLHIQMPSGCVGHVIEEVMK